MSERRRGLRRFRRAGQVTALGLALLLAGPLTACDDAPSSAAVELHERGVMLLEIGEPARAEESFAAALERDPEYAPSHAMLAALAEERGETAAAMGHLERAVAADESFEAAYRSLARLALANGRLETALRHVTTSFRLKPSDPAVLALKSRVMRRIGNVDSAVTAASDAVRIDPALPEGRLALADAVLARDGAEAALDTLRDRVAATDPALRAFRLALHDRLGQRDAAIAFLHDLHALRPGDPEIGHALYERLLAAGLTAAAGDWLDRRLAAMPGDIHARAAALRLTLAREGRTAAAGSLARLVRAGVVTADSAEHRLLRAHLARAGGDVGGAERLLEGLARPEHTPAPEPVLEGVPPAAAAAQPAPVPAPAAPRPAAEGAQIASLARQWVPVWAREGTPSLALSLAAASADATAGTDPAALLSEARLALDLGQAGVARESLEAMRARGPLDLSATVLFARTAAALDRPREANAAFSAALERAPASTEALVAYARFLMAEGRESVARRILEAASEQRPDDPDLKAALATLILARGDWEGAAEIAVELAAAPDALLPAGLPEASAAGAAKPGSAALPVSATLPVTDRTLLLQRLIGQALQGEDPERAKALLDRILAARPDHLIAQLLLARLEAHAGATETSRALCRAVIEAHPGASAAYAMLAELQDQAGERAEALAEVEAGIAAVSDTFGLRLMRARLLERLGRLEDAAAEYEILHAMAPGSIVIANNLASLIVETEDAPGRLARARELADRLRGSDLPQFQDTLGWTLARTGEPEAALPLLRSARAKLPDNVAVHYHLGVAYLEAGQPDEARIALETALSLEATESLPYHAKAKSALARANAVRPNQ
ncbi:MAG: tetratricopeptide repeat protein [Pseudomonadota bacterium]